VLAFVFKMSTSGIWIGLITGLTLASLFLIRRFLKMITLNSAPKAIIDLPGAVEINEDPKQKQATNR